MTELTTPRLHIKADRAVPERIGQTTTGNWMVNLTCEVVSHYVDDTRTVHANRCGELDDILMMESIEEEMRNLIQDWYIFDAGFRPQDSNTFTAEGEIITSYTIQLYCCPSVPEN
jgi:hypothetical protein